MMFSFVKLMKTRKLVSQYNINSGKEAGGIYKSRGIY